MEIIRADHIDEVDEAITRLQQAIDNDFQAAGFFSYELGYALEPPLHDLMPRNRQVPLIWFAIFPGKRNINKWQLDDFLRGKTDADRQTRLNNIRPLMQRDDYAERFERAKQFIAAGDIYQVNLTFGLTFDVEGHIEALYRQLRKSQPVAFGAFLESPEFSILSLSPELFFQIEKGEICTRPMKGTARRGANPGEDRRLSRRLQGDIKNRAENLMIVDLMRNDLARICETGSVGVEDLFRIETYPTLHQMTSLVKGRLRRDVDLPEIIRALVPAGSITGAPKVRAMQIISELEERPRGVYCGALGLLGREHPGGHLSARFNVAIRTLTLFPDGHGEAGIGSGIVQDSIGDDEYEECLLKARFLT